MRDKVPSIFPVKELLYAKQNLHALCSLNIFKIQTEFGKTFADNGFEDASLIDNSPSYQPWQDTPIAPKLPDISKGHLTIYKAVSCMTEVPHYKDIYEQYRDNKGAFFTTFKIGQIILMYVPKENLLFIATYD